MCLKKGAKNCAQRWRPGSSGSVLQDVLSAESRSWKVVDPPGVTATGMIPSSAGSDSAEQVLDTESNMRSVTVLLGTLLFTLQLVSGDPVGQRRNWYGRPKTQVDSEFQSEKTKVSLSCDTGKMVLKMNFADPFGGVVQMGPKSTRECTLRGDRRRTSYVMSVNPDACGSCKGHSCAPGTFVNTLYIRYHPTLERDGDDVKTVICKYQAGSIQTG